ncbi:MAG: LysM peptidoglycan-binding domain-containing protein [Clostridia bacterium]|nr:LysM peptidoglycan-binding domain-containing protein [Clostridia bacterium]
MRELNLLLILALVIAGVAGCGKLEIQDKLLVVGAERETAFKDKPQVFRGYIYDEQTGRCINLFTGNWYTFENGCIVIPSDQYIDRDDIARSTNISIENRPDNIWELKEIQNIIVQPGDTLTGIISPYFMNEHFRMNSKWYTKQVLELNNITDPHLIHTGDILKMPVFIDIESQTSQ